MELLILVIVAIILYLVTDNHKVAEQMRAEPNPALKAQKGCALGIGWYIIILLGAFLLLGSAVGFENLNVGMEDGSFTLTQPHDPNNPMTKPIGELLGVRP